jgi:lipopolysaccharide export system protein LptA
MGAALIGALTGLASGARALESAPPVKPEATITSDEMEVVNNGARTIFRGHVVLKEVPYELHADRMERTRATGVVQAWGHIVGTWVKPEGEKGMAEGDRARYDPADETTEWWDHARLTRWQTASDTAPVVVTADRFVAEQKEDRLLAHRNVQVTQGGEFWSQSDEGKFDHQQQTMTLWGKHPVRMHWQDARGTADFKSDQAVIFVVTKRTRLLDQVQGHVVPLSR